LRVRSTGTLPERLDLAALPGLLSAGETLARLADGLTWPVVALAAIGAFRGGRVAWHARAGSVAVAGIGLLLALGPGFSLVPGTPLPSFYELVASAVPGFGVLRAPQRFLVLPALALTFLAACGLTSIFGALRARGRPGQVATWVLLLVGAVFVVQTRAAERPVRLQPLDARGSEHDVHRWIAQQTAPGPVLELPAMISHLDPKQVRATGHYMIGSTLHWMPLLNGYTGYAPPSAALLMQLADRLPDRRAFDELCALVDVGTLVVHLDRMTAEERAIWGNAGLPSWLRLAHRDGAGSIVYQVERGCGELLPGFREELSSRPDGAEPRVTLRGLSLGPLPVGGYRGRIRAELPREISHRAVALLPVRVTNASDVPWPGLTTRREGTVAVQARWRDAETGVIVRSGQPTRLATDLGPGEEVRLRVELVFPPPGEYTLELGLVQIGVGWFVEQPDGAGVLRAPVRVSKARRAGRVDAPAG
jgi:hypothetical protein